MGFLELACTKLLQSTNTTTTTSYCMMIDGWQCNKLQSNSLPIPVSIPLLPHPTHSSILSACVQPHCVHGRWSLVWGWDYTIYFITSPPPCPLSPPSPALTSLSMSSPAQHLSLLFFPSPPLALTTPLNWLTTLTLNSLTHNTTPCNRTLMQCSIPHRNDKFSYKTH